MWRHGRSGTQVPALRTRINVTHVKLDERERLMKELVVNGWPSKYLVL